MLCTSTLVPVALVILIILLLGSTYDEWLCISCAYYDYYVVTIIARVRIFFKPNNSFYKPLLKKKEGAPKKK
jgi:hypothetical protein